MPSSTCCSRKIYLESRRSERILKTWLISSKCPPRPKVDKTRSSRVNRAKARREALLSTLVSSRVRCPGTRKQDALRSLISLSILQAYTGGSRAVTRTGTVFRVTKLDKTEPWIEACKTVNRLVAIRPNQTKVSLLWASLQVRSSRLRTKLL